MSTDMARFAETFLEEAGEHLAEMEAALLMLEAFPDDPEAINTIFRAAHSIKGASGTFGFDEIARFTHSLENVLDRMRQGTIDTSPRQIDLLLRASDVVRGLVDAARSDQPLPADLPEVRDELDAILGPEQPAAANRPADPCPAGTAAPREYRVVFIPEEDLFRQGMDPLLLLRELAQIGELLAIEVDRSRLPSLDDLDPESCYLSWSLRLRTTQTAEQIREIFLFVEEGSRIDIQAATEESARTTNQVPPAGTAADARRQTIKFLVVDDDPACGRILGKILSSYGHGHLAFNGAEATGIFRVALEDGVPYDLVCLDLDMPLMNGHEVLQVVRQIESQHGIGSSTAVKIIVVTANRESKDCIGSFSEGCDTYIIKPIDKGELLDRLRELKLVGAATA